MPGPDNPFGVSSGATRGGGRRSSFWAGASATAKRARQPAHSNQVRHRRVGAMLLSSVPPGMVPKWSGCTEERWAEQEQSEPPVCRIALSPFSVIVGKLSRRSAFRSPWGTRTTAVCREQAGREAGGSGEGQDPRRPGRVVGRGG